VGFVIAVVFYGQLRLLFGLTPRHIAIAVMLIACIKQQGVPFPMGRIMKTYFVFIFTYLVSATLTGYFGDVLIMYYIGACVGLWATKILVVKYQGGSLLLYLLIVLGVLDALVTIGQTFNMSFPDKLISFFQLSLPEEYLEIINTEGREDMVLRLTRPGLFANFVYNGYFLMTAGVVSLMLFTRKLWIQGFIPWVIISFGCFCVQERGPIIILALLSALAFYKMIISKKYALFILPFIFIVLSIAEPFYSLSYIGNDYSEFIEDSRFVDIGLNDSGRENIYSKTIDYLMEHPIIGGLHRLRAMYGIYPHNLFLIAFCYGGLVGGVTIMLILFWQIKPLWRVLRRKIADTNPVCFFAALAYLAYTLNSLVHNRSIVTGDELMWMLWGVFFFEYLKFYKQDSRL
jgi:hypothetical protein